jgi:hypothetical protein
MSLPGISSAALRRSWSRSPSTAKAYRSATRSLQFRRPPGKGAARRRVERPVARQRACSGALAFHPLTVAITGDAPNTRRGDKLFVHAGMKPTLVDPLTGEVIEVELFVAVLGASNFTYAKATRTQQVADSRQALLARGHLSAVSRARSFPISSRARPSKRMATILPCSPQRPSWVATTTLRSCRRDRSGVGIKPHCQAR